jgi:hypothetical protein
MAGALSPANALAGRAEDHGGRPSVLCIVDRPGWAHDRKTEALARELAPDYRVVKRFQAEVTAEEIAAADLVLLYYWLQLERLGERGVAVRRRADRLLVGICSVHEVSGAWEEPACELLRGLPAAVFANNAALVRWAEKTLGRRVGYTPNGVDTSFFVPAEETCPDGERPLRIGWAGSLANHGTEHRGVHEVIAPAVAAVPGAELRLAAREERWRDAAEMLAFYRELDVYVCASRSEGTPNPCLEAAACGLPLVTTAVGNMPEFVRDGENGFLVERDPAAFADVFGRLRDDEALRRRVGEAARRSVEAWDWKHLAPSYAALFAAVLRRDVDVAARASLPAVGV